MTLTPQQYVETRVCPVCKSHDLEGGPVEIIDAAAQQEVTCMKCHADWYDVYVLTGYDEDSLKLPPKEDTPDADAGDE